MMKKIRLIVIPALVAALLIPSAILAQETLVTIKVEKDGKVVKDTTYQFTDEDDAKHVLKLMEVVGEGGKEMEYHYKIVGDEGDGENTMIFVTKDGDKTVIKEIKGDSLIWNTKEGHMHGEHMVVMMSDDDEKGEVKKKNIKVMISEDDEGEWIEKGDKEVEEDIYIISGDKEDFEIEKILKEHSDDENVKIVVVKKKEKEKPEKVNEKE